jgi:hypothetical protein
MINLVSEMIEGYSLKKYLHLYLIITVQIKPINVYSISIVYTSANPIQYFNKK